MKKSIRCLVIFSFILIFAQKGVATENSHESESLKQLLAPLNSMQGNFEQIIRNEKGKILQRSKGNVWLKKPAQFRWEILEEEPRVVVSDGKQVWDYDKDLAQVVVQKLNQGQIRAPIYFLTGEVSSIDKDFVVKRNECLSESDSCFELTPKEKEGPFQWVKIGFKQGNLKEMELLDQLGQKSQFIFSNVLMNPVIPSQTFQFSPPPDVDILQN